ncbi:MAG: hypothetical protein V4607_06955 [Pseudomonadota bacterium]
MKEQTERNVAVSIAKKFRRIPAESIAHIVDQSRLFTARYMPSSRNRRVGTISLEWSKLS